MHSTTGLACAAVSLFPGVGARGSGSGGPTKATAEILRVAQNDDPEDGGPEEFAAGVATCTGLEPVIFCLKDRGLGHLVEHVLVEMAQPAGIEPAFRS